jgi:hypothetical protein
MSIDPAAPSLLRTRGGIVASTEARTMNRFNRFARGGLVAGLLVLAIAAPAAAATSPIRTVTYPQEWFAPAGKACTFDIIGVPTSGFEATTVFSDARSIRSVRVKGYYENLVNHRTYWVNDSWTELDEWDATTQLYTITGNGQIDVPFWPGDAGPFGSLVTTAAYYRFAGTTTNVLDYNGTPRTADFTWSGKMTDICAALA